MTTGQVIKTILKEISFYKRKTAVFSVAIIVIVIIYLIWQNFGRPQAAVEYKNLSQFPSSTVSMEVTLQKDGKVLIDGQRKNQVLRFYENYDELRILVFDSPGVFISHFKATVHLPSATEKENTRQIIYAVHGVGSTQTYLPSPKTLVYEAHDISPQATLTIVANLPKGMVEPSFWQKLEIGIRNLSVKAWLLVAIILPGITLILMLFMIIKRRSAQMMPIRGLLGGPPENIPPAIPGVLIDGTVGAREVAATLIDLARRGFIFIINKGNGNFSFGIRRGGDFEKMPGLAVFEKELLAKIFLPRAFKSTVADVEMRIGRHIFSRKIAKFYLEIYNEATKAGYFVKNPAKVHLIWKYTGVGLFFVSFIGFMLGAILGADPKFGLIFWVGGMASAAVMVKLSPYMPARTEEGNQELREWLEFREYLTDKRPASGVEASQGKFEEFLPYAIVLGAEVDWAKRFMREPFSKPDWYDSAERTVTLNTFAGQLFPLIGYVAENLARSHEPTVE